MPKTEPAATAGSTRERILDVAQHLFATQGYDKTSLRDIAEQLGVTKAALYYHFERKEDIFLALHLRLHALSHEVLDELNGLSASQVVERWPSLLDQFIDAVLENRELFQMHERNRNALEELGRNEHHDAEQEEMEQAFKRTLGNRDIAPEQRMRMLASIGAVAAGLLGGGEIFDDLTLEQRAGLVREIARGVVEPPG